MPEAQFLCDAAELTSDGTAVGFDVLQYGRAARGFAIRHNGVVRAYLNQCAHVPVEMDWQTNQFWDQDRTFLICSVHGALYVPESGLCVSGPCRGARLKAIQSAEQDGKVYWYPSEHIQPAP